MPSPMNNPPQQDCGDMPETVRTIAHECYYQQSSFDKPGNNREKIMDGNSKRILHVEDSKSFQQYIGALLAGIVEITGANTLKEARVLIKDAKFDLVLLDFTLPDGSGSDLINELAEHKPPVPVIVFSAHELTNNMVNVKNVFVKGHFSEQDLTEAVRSSCS
jgi:CheY-like chemotaxis protein